MALKTFAVAVTLITGIGFAATADARCSGKSFGDRAIAVTPNAPAAEIGQPVVDRNTFAWTRASDAPAAAPIVSADDDALAEFRQNAGLDRIPVDANGMPRRRC